MGKLVEYSKINSEFKQNDLKKENAMLSLSCILFYYSENFNDINSVWIRFEL